ncbi:GTPase [Azospirillum thermophilum]|nr:GTPase [Azospirillum thermophilum]
MPLHDEVERIRGELYKDDRLRVSVALFGQPGAGKSSLINKMIGQKLAAVGVETDKTVSAGEYESKGITFVDLPGYGTKKFPKEGYFEEFDIPSRDLFLCVTSGKLLQSDAELFSELIKFGKICIFVSNKYDELWEDDIPLSELKQRRRDDIVKHVGHQVPVVFTSCRTNEGLDDLQNLIAQNLHEAKRERWLRSAKAYSQVFLEEKKNACERKVQIAAAVSAANGLNPIPGTDVAVDISTLVVLFREIRESYGLADELVVELKQQSVPLIAQLAGKAAQYAAKEGILMLLKSVATREVVKTTVRFVPVVGQLIAASIGFGITYSAGMSYLKDCHDLATEVLNKRLSY